MSTGVTEARRGREPDALRCPNCGAELTRLVGRGYVETLCPACRFARPQSPFRPFEIAGGLLGWWAACWIIMWWEARTTQTA